MNNDITAMPPHVVDIEKTRLIALITKNADNIINNKEIAQGLADSIADVITKHLGLKLEGVQTDEEATEKTIIAMLEVYISLLRNTVNVERIITEKYNVSNVIIDPLKIEATLSAYEAFDRVSNNIEDDDEDECDPLASNMYR